MMMLMTLLAPGGDNEDDDDEDDDDDDEDAAATRMIFLFRRLPQDHDGPGVGWTGNRGRHLPVLLQRQLPVAGS